MWDEWAEGIQEQKNEEEFEYDAQERQDRDEGSFSSSSNLNFDFLTLVSQPKVIIIFSNKDGIFTVLVGYLIRIIKWVYSNCLLYFKICSLYAVCTVIIMNSCGF